MMLRVLSPLFVSLPLLACGGAPKPEAAQAENQPAPAASEGAAVEHDPYANFDANAIGTEAESNGGAGGSAPEAGSACQRAAEDWSKRARPGIKLCYREGKKSDPNLMGTARIVVDVDYQGKAKPARLDGTSSLGDDVANCMVKAVTSTNFPDATECASRTLTIPVEFPTPRR